MQYSMLMKIKDKLEKYTKKYRFGNNVGSLNFFITAHLEEEKKELLLNDLDKMLPLGLFFSHQYENGRLKIIFKEVQ